MACVQAALLVDVSRKRGDNILCCLEGFSIRRADSYERVRQQKKDYCTRRSQKKD
jgi:hypothetical protein